MGPKRKPNQQQKKTRQNKTKDQGLLFRYFPNLNPSKSKTYQNILNKPNGVFKEQKKLNDQILNEQNQVIKEINNLFFGVFKEAYHDEINDFALHFQRKAYSQALEMSHPQNKQTKFRSGTCIIPSLKAQSENSDEESETKTISVKKFNLINFEEFKFHQPQLKLKEKQLFQASKKYQQPFDLLEKSDQSWEKHDQSFQKIKNQQFIQSDIGVSCNDFRFDSDFGVSQIKSIIKETVKQEIQQSQTPQDVVTITNQQQKLTPSKIQQNFTNEKSTQMGFQFSDKHYETLEFSLKDYEQPQKDNLNDKIQKIHSSIDRIIDFIEKKEKAKQQEINFKQYVQQVKLKQISNKNLLQKQNEMKLSCPGQSTGQSKYLQKHRNENDSYQEEPISFVDKNSRCFFGQYFHKNQSELDILDYILHQETNPEFCFQSDYQMKASQENDDERQFSDQIKDTETQVKYLDECSTKEQSHTFISDHLSSETVHSFPQIQPSFEILDYYLQGFLKDKLTADFFNKIHDFQFQKLALEWKVSNTLI